jgi:hypothetical protein
MALFDTEEEDSGRLSLHSKADEIFSLLEPLRSYLGMASLVGKVSKLSHSYRLGLKNEVAQELKELLSSLPKGMINVF